LRLRILALALLALGALAPTVRAADVAWSAFGTQGSGGWYRSDVWINWTLTNVVPPLTQECQPVHLVADTPGTAATCTVTDNSGATTKNTTAIKIDQTPPTVTAAASRPPDANGWFNHPVGFTFSGSDATSGVAACNSTTYEGPDSGAAGVGGTCRDVAGNVASPVFPLKYDATPPTVTGGLPARPPDSNGWFVSPISLAFTATDATSGVDSCDTVPYGGPDSGAADVTGACRDKAGNTGVGSAAVAYDATPPTLSSVSAAPGDTVATVTWKTTSDTKLVNIMRTPGPSKPVFRGNAKQFGDRSLKNGVSYTYTLTAIDAPGHTTTKTVKAKPTAWLLTPSPGAERKAPPWLRWKPVKNATFYNVQLFRGKRKILSAWPRKPRFKLHSAWRYNGHWHRLSPDTYRWYVWPAYGDRNQRRYGRLRGARSFKMI
jgi:hypothetical protein